MNFAENQGSEVRFSIRALEKKSVFQFLQDFNESSKTRKITGVPVWLLVQHVIKFCRLMIQTCHYQGSI